MDLHDETGTEGRFRAYAADLASVLGHADRVRPFEDYCVGLLSARCAKASNHLRRGPRRSEPPRSTSRCCILWRKHPGLIRRY